MKRLFSLLLALVLAMGLLPAAAEEEISYTGTVTGGSLHMRREPSPSGKVITTYKAGTKVTILENDGTWCKVQLGSRIGYMMAQYLKIEASYPQLGWGQTEENGTLVNLRAKPDDTSPIVHKAMSGFAAELIEKAGGYYKVRVGQTFGYLPESLVTPISGEFALGLTGTSQGSPLTAADFYSALREVGNPLSIKRTEGDFTCSLNYPDLGIEAADSAMHQWVESTMGLFEQDHAKNHSGTKASYTVEYQALKIDERYQSVLLLGEYRVGSQKVETALALNVDVQEGKLLQGPELLKAGMENRLLFSLESGVYELMGVPTDGYEGKPQLAWMEHAVLTREGIQVCLPMGLHLPFAMGTRLITLPYEQTAQCLALDSALIAGFIRVIDPTKPMIALTFDDGPSEETERILNVLAEYNARATFCVLGSKVEAHGDIIKRAIAEGNEIACHTWSHKKLTKISVADIRSQIGRTNDAVRELTGGYEIKVLRPPYGSVNKNVRDVCRDYGMIIAHWKIDTRDWDTRSSSKTYRAIMNGASNGVIILCHDLYSSTASAIEKAVPELVAKGYQLVTVSELMSFHKDGAQPGTVYAYLDPENIRK